MLWWKDRRLVNATVHTGGSRLKVRFRRMHRVLVNVMSNDWSVHFIGPDGKTRIGPWLLLDSHDEVVSILRWGNITAEELAVHESSIRCWSVSSVVVYLTNEQIAALIRRGRGWPWTGYELRQMKAAGKYPPQLLTIFDHS